MIAPEFFSEASKRLSHADRAWLQRSGEQIASLSQENLEAMIEALELGSGPAAARIFRSTEKPQTPAELLEAQRNTTRQLEGVARRRREFLAALERLGKESAKRLGAGLRSALEALIP